MTPEKRRGAARAGRGALKALDVSTADVLRERRVEDAWRDRRLGL